MADYVVLMKIVDPNKTDTAVDCIGELARRYELSSYDLRLVAGEYDLILTASFESDVQEVAFVCDARLKCGVTTASLNAYTVSTYETQIRPRRMGS